jgi:hypothetical protein
MVGSVGKKCSEATLGYIAGLFDCDGAIMASIESHKEKKFGFRVRIILKLTQKNPQLLHWIHSLLEVGNIAKNRTTFDWIVKNQQDCKEILELIGKYSRGKQNQVQLALQILNTQVTSKSDLLHIAQLADTLSGFNVRSFGRRLNYASKIQEYFSSND